ncbi:uncharacterized protein LOC114928895 [Nylanderia fulva]|uniref:uncharacterized protein LOC114928895 n=1 Tax=Nylanderia fulva TaxID=613905 RepID=UPI0010FB3C40|nr:uncharacterized protein LOC114928895 [Nylanderia fulva]
MDTLQEYIFGILNFRAHISSYVPEDIKWLCIDYVLQSKVGPDIILYTIFHSVARKLGLRCDLIDIWSCCCIFWKPEFVTNNLENARCFNIVDDKYPNCLCDYLPYYRCIEILRHVTETGTEEMLDTIKSFVEMIISGHTIIDLGLVKVNISS